MIVVEHCKRDEDVDGCPCLRCRSVDPQLLRRSIVGDVLWAVALLGRRPSLFVLVVVLTIVTGALWPLLERGPQTWPIGTALVVYIAIHATVLRAYTVAVTTDALTDSDSDSDSDSGQSAWRLFVGSQRWLPVIAAVAIATVAVSAVALLLVSMSIWISLQGIAEIDAVLGTSIATESVFDGVSATLLFGSVMVVSIFKFWLASESCVAGGYGPLTGLWVSWTITSLYWWRILLVVAGFTATVTVPELGGRAIAAVGGAWLLANPITDLAKGLVFGLGYAVWFAVGTQIYVRHVVDDSRR